MNIDLGGENVRVDRIATLALASVLVAMLLGCPLLDGPSGPIPGGRLRTGAIVSEPDVDWSFADGQMIELQLVEPLGSRTTAVMVHEGQLYVPCDLGFIFRRVPAFHPARWMLSLIYRVKHWHEDVLRDGRVVLRIDGRRYERQAVRVTDPELVATLRLQMEKGAEEFFSNLREAPTDDPKDVWFFRIEPRPTM